MSAALHSITPIEAAQPAPFTKREAWVREAIEQDGPTAEQEAAYNRIGRILLTAANLIAEEVRDFEGATGSSALISATLAELMEDFVPGATVKALQAKRVGQ